MNEALLKRRLIAGPVGVLMAVYCLALLSDEAGWSGGFVPSVAVGAVVGVGLSWYIVKSERSQANRARVNVRVGLIVVAAIGAGLFLRLAPVVVIYGVCVLVEALAMALTLSAIYELKAGTYAEPKTRR